MRPFTKFLLLVLACALNVASAHASGLHAIPADKRDVYLKALRAQSEKSHARKLLSGAQCLAHTTSASADVFYGSCGGLMVKDEGHWCDMSDTTVANYIDTNTPYDSRDVAAVYPTLCVADSSDDCCTPNGGAVAGVVIGCVAGLAAIITLFAFCCKCCCFRPKQVVVMQQQPAAAPQVVVVPAAK